VLSTMERDVALFWRTKNTVEPRFDEQRTWSNRVEYNGARRGLVSANKEHARISFWSTRPGLSTSCSLSALFCDAVRASIYDRDKGVKEETKNPSVTVLPELRGVLQAEG